MSTSFSRSLIPEPNIYVICPANIVTGGPELLHQLVDSLVSSGRNAFIVYWPLGTVWATPLPYARYKCPVALTVRDATDCAVIVPEVNVAYTNNFKLSRRIIWWLSVDNYRGSFESPSHILLLLRRLIFNPIHNVDSVLHLCQSDYALNFVKERFGCDGVMLSDYLADEYLVAKDMVEKLDQVAFNPLKGFRFTRQLIKACPEFKFVALKKMSRIEVGNALSQSLVYIDFGPHPGKDRIPREAAMCGAVVIVGNQGAAKFVKDVPIPLSYKFERRRSSVALVKAMLLQIMSNRDLHYERQALFRQQILKEKEIFFSQMRKVFGINGSKD